MSPVCRVCLISDLPMRSIENIQLLEVFTKLTGSELKTKVGMQCKACYICYFQLQRCTAFANKARASERILRDLILNGIEISESSVAYLKPKPKLLVSPIQHMSINDQDDNRYTKVEIKKEFIEQEDATKTINLETMQLISNNNIKAEQVEIKKEFDIQGTIESDNIQHLIEDKSKPNTIFLDWSCIICSKQFAQKSLLLSHLQTHKYPCDVCSSAFSKKHQLRAHKKTHINTFICKLCGKQSNCKGNLLLHMKIHSREKLYICDICSKAFTFKASLITHLQYHAGYKKYSCDKCKKKFVEASTLRRHMVVHTKIKPFSCSRCPTMFTEAGSLRRHMKSHLDKSDLICAICDKSYTRKDHLTRHLLSHCSENHRFCCDKCDKKYTEASNLKRHIKVHHPS